MNHLHIWGRNIPKGENWLCKGPEAGMCLADLSNNLEARMTRALVHRGGKCWDVRFKRTEREELLSDS